MRWRFLALFACFFLLACSGQEEVPENVSQLNNLGVYYANQGNDEKAIEFFNKVLKIDMSHATARKNIGLIYFKQGKYNKSIDEFELLTQLYPEEPLFHYNLGISLAERCRRGGTCELNKSIAAFEKAEELEPGYQAAENNIEALENVREQMNNQTSNETTSQTESSVSKNST